VRDAENLVVERDRVVVPVLWLNASTEQSVSVAQRERIYEGMRKAGVPEQ
jgi:hypothetical protein